MKVLFTPYCGGAIAHVARLLPIADELAARGHATLFTTSVSKKAFIEAAGHAVHGAGHADVNLNDEHDQGIGYFAKNRAAFMHWLGDELAAAEAFRPDVIVSSPSFFGPIASLKFGIPQVSVINAQWLPEFKGLLGLSRSSDSLRHRIERALGKPFFEHKFSSSYLREIRSFYTELGIAQLPRNRRELNQRTAVLVPGSAQFEPVEHSARKDLHYVGPLFWSGFERAEFDRTALFGDDASRPLVYVSLGGSVYRRQSYEELIAALAARTDWDVLLTLGPNFSREGFARDRPGFVVQAYTPGHKASEHADIVVTTGGHGTVMQALWHGKPVVALPHNIDQATIAARVEELGVGVNLNPVGLRDFADRQRYFDRAISIPWDRVVERTAQALGDRALHENARRFAPNLTRLGDAKKTAADLVERYAGAVPARAKSDR
ncbi:MAG TPA: nucleotide disphospho-sugar-binding domain-containing protein [Dokdonella sp.]